jgi:hypothetical protein
VPEFFLFSHRFDHPFHRLHQHFLKKGVWLIPLSPPSRPLPVPLFLHQNPVHVFCLAWPSTRRKRKCAIYMYRYLFRGPLSDILRAGCSVWNWYDRQICSMSGSGRLPLPAQWSSRTQSGDGPIEIAPGR